MVASNAKRQTKAAEPDGGDGILRIGEDAEEPRYETLFKLDGEPFEVLVNPPASLMLQYFHRSRTANPSVALSWLLEQMVGDDAYKALLESPKVTTADFNKVVALVLGIVLGNPERLPKSSANGSPRTSGSARR